MPIVSSLIFRAAGWGARKGLREAYARSPETKKHVARRTGIRGEASVYWYLPRRGYVFVPRNFTPPRFKRRNRYGRLG